MHNWCAKNNILIKMNKILLEIENIESCKILNRPSKISKTPYVADIIIQNSIFQAHSPSLGCCGLCEKESKVFAYPLESKTKKKAICSYRIFLSEIYEEDKEHLGYIGIEPKLAENLVEEVLKKNYFSKINNIKFFKREVKILDSRFDFMGIDNNDETFIIEVKNVPLADYADISEKEKRNLNFDNKNFDEKISYFPDGYRKKKGELVSERAYKHIKDLMKIKQASINTRCILCFVIQRDDISSFQPSNLDPIYQNTVKEAFKNGVEIFTLVVRWNYSEVSKKAECIFITDNLKINFV